MRFATLALAAALCTPAPPARAQGAPDAPMAQAQQLVNESAGYFRDGDFERALTALRAAEPLAAEHDQAALPTIRFNIARCLEQLERWAEAHAAYEAYNLLPDQEHRKQRAWQAVRAIEKRIYGGLTVTCTRAGAVVRIGGREDGPRPCPARFEKLEPGPVTVVVDHPQAPKVEQSVTVVAGETATLDVAVEIARLGPPVLVPAQAPPPAPESSSGPWPWVTMGAGAAVLGAGAALTFLAIDARDAAEGMVPGDDRDVRVDDFELDRTLSYVAYGLGGAAVAAGIALFFVGDDGAEAAVSPAGPLGVRIRW